MFVNVATKSAQHAHARMITTVIEKVQTQIMRPCDHGFINDVINTPIARQSVNHKKIFSMIKKQQKNYILYTSEYNAKSCLGIIFAGIATPMK